MRGHAHKELTRKDFQYMIAKFNSTVIPNPAL